MQIILVLDVNMAIFLLLLLCSALLLLCLYAIILMMYLTPTQSVLSAPFVWPQGHCAHLLLAMSCTLPSFLVGL